MVWMWPFVHNHSITMEKPPSMYFEILLPFLVRYAYFWWLRIYQMAAVKMIAHGQLELRHDCFFIKFIELNQSAIHLECKPIRTVGVEDVTLLLQVEVALPNCQNSFVDRFLLLLEKQNGLTLIYNQNLFPVNEYLLDCVCYFLNIQWCLLPECCCQVIHLSQFGWLRFLRFIEFQF